MFGLLGKFIVFGVLALTAGLGGGTLLSQVNKTPSPTPSSQEQNRILTTSLTNTVNDWEKSRGYQPYVEDNQLCSIAALRLSELQKDLKTTTNLKSYQETTNFTNMAENYSNDLINADQILNSWVHNDNTYKNLKDYYKYSCIRCENELCVQIFGNKSAEIASDPIEPCTSKNSGNSIRVKRSECQNKYVDCQISNTWKVLTQEECNSQQNTQAIQQPALPSIYKNTNTKFRCAYSHGDYSYDYGELTYEECDVKIKAYFAQKQAEINSAYPSPTPGTNQADVTQTSQQQTTVSTTSCYNQYNSDVQRANSYGGNVGTAMKDMATSNLNSCLRSGQVIAVPVVQQDPPKDRDGKLCSSYSPELLGYSKEMGCP